MPKVLYNKKTKNGKEYFFFRLRHKNLKKPKDLYGKTAKELTDKIKALTNELDQNIKNNKDSFETFFEDWLFDVKFVNLKPSTKEKYEGIYRNYIKNSPLSNINIKEISLRDIQEYYNKLIKKGSSVNCILSLNKLIAPCIRYAYNNNLILRDFTGAITLPIENEKTKLEKTSKILPFSLDEQKIFIKAIKGHELEMLFITALNTGMRQGELFALTWNDINFNEGYIDVNKTVKYISNVSREGRSKGDMIVTTPKTAKSLRKVKMPIFLIDKLKQYKVKQNKHRLAMANLYQNNNLVFCNLYGKYYDSGNVRKRLNKIIDKINENEEDISKHIAHRKFHDLRHTYATRLFELGETPKTVQELLGHSDVSITLNTYTHVLERMKVETASKLNDLYLTMG